MFPALKAEIDARFSAMASFFDATKEFSGDDAMLARGLMFVQAYAAYEYTVTSVVQGAIDGIKAHNHRLKDLSPPLLALFLDPELQSLRDTGRKSVWDKRLQVFDRAFSKDRANLPAEAGIPHDGSHFKYSQLQVIYRVFGLKRLPVTRRAHIPRIDEVVGHRNQIAHGSETAIEVGRRYTWSEIALILRQMRSICLLQVQVFETYCANKSRHCR